MKLPAIQESLVRFLGLEDLLEKGTATHFSILAWRIPWTEAPAWLQPLGSPRVGQDRETNTFTSQNFIPFLVPHDLSPLLTES